MDNLIYADVIVPVAVKGKFTYLVPDHLRESVQRGSAVVVQFGASSKYHAIVTEIHDRKPATGSLRPLLEIARQGSVVSDIQLKFWDWLSEYYLCTSGEVMKAAISSDIFVPAAIPKGETFIELAEEFSNDELNSVLDKLSKAPKQQELLASYLRLSEYGDAAQRLNVKKATLSAEAKNGASALDTLCAKGILRQVQMPLMSKPDNQGQVIAPRELSPAQGDAFTSIISRFREKEITLLHGITSSGKTEIYIHLIEEQIKAGRQVLYMLPEIALTTQIIERLKKHFGSATGIYHSKLKDSEKSELWHKLSDDSTTDSYNLVLGVRSSLFLPFRRLGLIIVDEEHDASYKQQDPAPRYHARDSAIMLAALHGAKTLLGSATPSIESYNNALRGKYGLVELNERFGLINLPEIVLANTREAYRKKLMVSHFTPELLYAVDDALGKGEQVILFQNRRGFSPYIECSECGWIPVCIQCAVNMTYHKGEGRLVCHYCGHSVGMLSKCGNCNSTSLVTRGFGTEKIEDEIKIVFPKARVARMDQDTTRSRNAFNRLIGDFENRKIDILIGTQMISKGLDFENLTVVGILNADNMLNYPDFRAHERSFQLMEQVSGRAGRRQKQGRVIIQTSDPTNRIIRMVLRHDYKSLFKLQTEERQAFNYPPFSRIIKITLKHKDRSQVNYFSDILGTQLRGIFGKRVLGPEAPVISQVQSWYLKTIIIKIEQGRPPAMAKQMIAEAISGMGNEKGSGGLRIAVDVDPY